MLENMASGSGRVASPRGAKAGVAKTRAASSATARARSGTGSRSATGSRAATGSRVATGSRTAGNPAKGRSSTGRADHVARTSSARSASSASRGISGATRASSRADISAPDEGRPRRRPATGTSVGSGTRGRSGARDGAAAWARPAAAGASRGGGRGFGAGSRAPVSSERVGPDRPRPSTSFRAGTGGATRVPARGTGRDGAGSWEPAEDRGSSRQGAGVPSSRARSATGAERPPARAYGERIDRPSRGTGGGGTYRGDGRAPRSQGTGTGSSRTYRGDGRAAWAQGTGIRSDRANFANRSTGDGPRWGRPVASGHSEGAAGRGDVPRALQPRSSDRTSRSSDGRASRFSDDRTGQGQSERGPRGFQTNGARASSLPKRLDSRGAPAGRAAWEREAPRASGPRRETGAPPRETGAPRREAGGPRREPKRRPGRERLFSGAGGRGWERLSARLRPGPARPTGLVYPAEADAGGLGQCYAPRSGGAGSRRADGFGDSGQGYGRARNQREVVRRAAPGPAGRYRERLVVMLGGAGRDNAGRAGAGTAWAGPKPVGQAQARRTPAARRTAVAPLTGPLSPGQELEGQASDEGGGPEDWSMTIVERVPAPSRRAQPPSRRAQPAARPSVRSQRASRRAEGSSGAGTFSEQTARAADGRFSSSWRHGGLGAARYRQARRRH